MKKANRRAQAQPSRRALREMPETDFRRARVRKNPFARRIALDGIVVQVGRGRPRRVLEVGGTSPRSVRFPEAIWSLLEHMRLSRPDADIFVPDGVPMPDALRRATHVCVGTHQDDQEFMAFHGIAECFGRKDRGFAGVVVTNGAGSARTDICAGYTNEDMVRVRVKEQRKAATIGEYACQIQFMHPSSDVKKAGHPGVLADLRAVFEVVRPEVLYLHNPADKHDTHVACCLRSIEAIRALPKGERPLRRVPSRRRGALRRPSLRLEALGQNR